MTDFRKSLGDRFAGAVAAAGTSAVTGAAEAGGIAASAISGGRRRKGLAYFSYLIASRLELHLALHSQFSVHFLNSTVDKLHNRLEAMAEPPSGLVNAFSTMGTVLAVGLFASQVCTASRRQKFKTDASYALVSQIPSYYTVVKNKTVGGMSVIPTVCCASSGIRCEVVSWQVIIPPLQLGTWVNVSAWVTYGLVVGDSSVLLVNLIGAAFALSYLALFWVFRQDSVCQWQGTTVVVAHWPHHSQNAFVTNCAAAPRAAALVSTSP